MNYKIIRFTKLILDFMFYSGILTCIFLFPILKFWGTINPRFVTYAIPFYILFLISGIFAVLIIYELRRMFRTVLLDDCFVTANVSSLQRMGTYSFCIAMATICRLFFYITPGALVVILVFIIAGLFSKVLSYVFERAVSYKMENDLTI